MYFKYFRFIVFWLLIIFSKTVLGSCEKFYVELFKSYVIDIENLDKTTIGYYNLESYLEAMKIEDLDNKNINKIVNLISYYESVVLDKKLNDQAKNVVCSNEGRYAQIKFYLQNGHQDGDYTVYFMDHGITSVVKDRK